MALGVFFKNLQSVREQVYLLADVLMLQVYAVTW